MSEVMGSQAPNAETDGDQDGRRPCEGVPPSLAALLEADASARALLSAVRDADGAVVDFRFIAANSLVCQHLGLPQDEVVGGLLTVVQPQTDPERIALYAQVLASGEPIVWSGVRFNRFLDGAFRVVDFESFRVDENTLSQAFRDVTDRFLAEDGLRDSEGLFRSVMQSSPIGLCLVATDGSFLRVNPALCEVLGRDEDVLMSCTWQELTHPDDVGADQQLVDEVLAGGRDGYRIVKRYLRPDGAVVWGDLSVGCVRTDTGAVKHFISQIVDVTAHRRVEQEYRLLAENASDLVFRSNPALELQWVSPAVATVLGWQPDDLVGTSVRDLVHPADVPAMAQAVSTAAGEFISYRARFRCKDGGWKWLAITARPVFENGVLVGRIGSGRDIDAEQAAADALSEQYRYLRAVIDSELDARVRVEPVRDESGTVVDLTYVDANPQALAFLGRTSDEIVGVRMLDLFPGQRSSGLFDGYVHTLLTGEPLVVDDLNLRSDVTEDGLWMDLRAVKVDDALSITWRVVTERHQAQEALAQSEARYRLLAENSSDVVGVGDNDGVTTWISESAREQLGWSPEEIVGHRFGQFIHEDDRDALRGVQQAVLAGEEQRLTVRVRSAAGTYRWYDMLVRPMRDDEGRVVGRIGAWRDVHEQYEARRELEESRAQYRLVAENAADVVLLVNKDLETVWLSPSAGPVTGWDRNTLTGGQGWRLVHPDDQDMIRDLMLAVFDSGKALSTEVRFLTRDGDYQFWHASIRLGDGGEGPELVVSLRNVDSEVRARQEARAQNARRRAILDSMIDPHVLLKAIRDDHGQIIDFLYADANEAACAYNQMPHGALVGASLLELLPGHRGSGLFAQYCHTVDTGEALILDDFVYPHEILAEPRHFDIRAVRVGDAMSFTWRDVTDRALAAEQVAESERRYRLLADNSADTILLASDGIMRWLSPSLTRLLGYQPQEWAGHRFEEFTHPDDVKLAQARREEINAGQARFTRLRMRHQDGTYHWIDISAAPLSEEQGGGIVASMRDADALVKAERELAMSEERFRLIATNTADILGLADANGILQWVSPSITAALGWQPEQWVGRQALDYVHPDDLQIAREGGGLVMQGQEATVRLRIADDKGIYHWAESRATSFTGGTGTVQGLVAAMTIIDERVAWEDQLRHAASHDPLTGLLTRDEAYRRLSFMLKRTGTKTFLAFIDMDNLKEVNDTLGHHAGDQLLRIVAVRIRQTLRDADQVARVGGDEMLLILPGMQNTEAAVSLMERLLYAVAEPHPLADGKTLHPHMSIGLTEVHPDEDIEHAVQRADDAMYQAKSAGGDSIHVSD